MDDKYAHLLQPIRDLAANWNVNIANDLEDYLVGLQKDPQCCSHPARAQCSAVQWQPLVLLIPGSLGRWPAVGGAGGRAVLVRGGRPLPQLCRRCGAQPRSSSLSRLAQSPQDGSRVGDVYKHPCGGAVGARKRAYKLYASRLDVWPLAAALLIQGSACIYSKKVEYLHTLVYQALEFIAERR